MGSLSMAFASGQWGAKEVFKGKGQDGVRSVVTACCWAGGLGNQGK